MLYIGVDGGGTKTAYALFDENKNMLHYTLTKGSNHENLEGSFEEAADILMEGITALLKEAGKTLSDITEILMGLAGIDHQFQHDALYKILFDRGLRNFRIYNDGFIVTKAGSPDGTGIGYNCGTGTCCNSVSSDGKMLQVGGFGAFSGDKGNGMWIVERTFRAVYNDVCLRIRGTSLTAAFCDKFGIKADREGVLSLIPSLEREEPEVIRPIIDMFFDALNAGDEAAELVAEEMAQRGAEFIASHVFNQKFDGEQINVVLSGSMHTKLPSGKYIEKLMKYAEEKSGRKLNFIRLSAAPVTGCINWMLEDK